LFPAEPLRNRDFYLTFPADSVYLGTMARKKNSKRLPKAAAAAKAQAAAMARQTAGRNTRFFNRKKEANRKACRGKVDHD
jgi:hypothetical protein